MPGAVTNKIELGNKALLEAVIDKTIAAFGAIAFADQPGVVSEKSLNEFLKQNIQRLKRSGAVICQIDGVSYNAKLQHLENDDYRLSFTRIAVGGRKTPRTDQADKLGALQLRWTDKTPPNNLSCEIKQENSDNVVVVRDCEKRPLYASHLVVLKNMAEHLRAGKTMNMLIALATGSGKTTIQALWALVCHIAQVKCIFALPGTLVPQFRGDFERLLHPSVMSSIGQVTAQNNFDFAAKNIWISDYETLLDQHFDALQQLNPKEWMMSFDEQHLVMSHEVRKNKLLVLAKKFLDIFLTATPDEATYVASGRKPVALLSSKSKAAANQGAFPELIDGEPLNLREKLSTLKTVGWWSRLRHRLKLMLADSILPDVPNLPRETFNELRYLYSQSVPSKVRAGDRTIQRDYQSVTTRKMLVIADDHETLINLSNYVNFENLEFIEAQRRKFDSADDDDRPVFRDAYRNGNIVDRQNIYQLFMLDNSDHVIENQYREAKLKSAKAAIHKDFPATNGFSPTQNFKDQLDHILYQNLLDYYLCDLLGIDQRQLDQTLANCQYQQRERTLFIDQIKTARRSRRRFNEAQLQNHFRRKLTYSANNKNGIDEQGAEEIARLLSLFETMETAVFNRVDQSAANLGTIDSNFKFGLKRYADKKRMLFLIEGAEHCETEIQEKPFWGFEEKEYSLYDDKGCISEQAKRRKRHTMELLNDKTKEFKYEPRYDEAVTEEIADNYFKLGFTAMYVSNKRTEGFSDVNCHSVISFVPSIENAHNDPTKVVQAVGRNRGLNPRQQPMFVQARARGVSSPFKLSYLRDHDDYYPAYFKARSQFRQHFIDNIGHRVAEEMKVWVYKNRNKLDQVDPNELHKACMRSIVRALRALNNESNHQVKLSRAQLVKVLDVVQQDLDKEIASIKKPYAVPTLVKAIGNIMYGASRVTLAFSNLSVGLRMTLESLKPKKNQYDRLYLKLISKHSLVDFYEQSLVANELKNYLTKTQSGLLATVDEIKAKHANKFLSKKACQRINELVNDSLIDGLVLCIHKDKRDAVLAESKEFQDWADVLFQQKETFEQLSKAPKKEAYCKKLLLAVPAIALIVKDLPTVDIDQQIAESKHAIEDANNKLQNLDPEYFDVAAVDETLLTFFENHFAKLFQHACTAEDHARVCEIVKSPDVMKAIVKQVSVLLRTNIHTPYNVTFEGIFEIVQQNIPPQDDGFVLKLPQEKTQAGVISLTKIQESVNDGSCIDAASKTEINKICKEQLLPALAKWIGDEQLRREALQSAIQYDDWAMVLLSEKETFVEAQQDPVNTSKKLAECLFSKLPGFENKLSEKLIDYPGFVTQTISEIKQEIEDLQKLENHKMDAARAAGSALATKASETSSAVSKKMTQAASKAKGKLKSFFGRSNNEQTEELISGDASSSDLHTEEQASQSTSGTSVPVVDVSLIERAKENYLRQYLMTEKFYGKLQHLMLESEALQIKSALKDQSKVQALAAALLRNKEEFENDHSKLLDIFTNTLGVKIQRIDHVLLNSGQSLVDVKKRVEDSVRARVRDVAVNEFMPVFVILLKDQQIAKQLVEKSKTYEQWPEFFEELKKHGNIDIDELKPLLKSLFKKIDPTLQAGDIVFNDTDKIFSEVSESIREIFVKQGRIDCSRFFTSDTFLNAMQIGFSKGQLEKFRLGINSSPENRLQFVEAISAERNMSDETFVELYNEHFPNHNVIKLDDQIEETRKELQSMSDKPGHHVDLIKLSRIIHERFFPLISHPELYAALNFYLSDLDEQELTDLLWYSERQPKADSARNILRFMQLLKKRDYQVILDEFLTIKDPESLNGNDLSDVVLFNQVLTDAFNAINVVRECNNWYHNVSDKGDIVKPTRKSVAAPQFVSQVTCALQNIKRNTNGSESTKTANKLIFLQGIRRGLHRAGEISAHSNHNLSRIFNRINRHIVAPVRARCNSGRFGVMMSDAAAGIRAMANSITHGVKNMMKACQLFFYSPRDALKPELIITHPSIVSRHYDKCSAAVAEQLRSLKPISKADIAKYNEKQDIFDDVFTQIDQLPPVVMSA